MIQEKNPISSNNESESKDEKHISGRKPYLLGVALFLSKSFKINPKFLRALFIFLTLIGGWGIIIYFLLYLFIPIKNKEEKNQNLNLKLAGSFLLIIGIYEYLNRVGIYLPFNIIIEYTEYLMAGYSFLIITRNIEAESLTESYQVNQENKIYLGVLAGFAVKLNISVDFLRILFIISIFISLGSIIPAYFIFYKFSTR